MKRQRLSLSADLSAAGLPVTSESRQSSDPKRTTCNGHLCNNEHTLKRGFFNTIFTLVRS
uniref:Uncharacterized protein n=1 Tax=Anguilla anguilla TaxID=7936 RepID=A0A0E9R7V1_ANGAN